MNAWNDETLFSGGSYSILKPNVMILMDNSGSMNNVIFHPDFNPGLTYGDNWSDTGQYEFTSTINRTYNGHTAKLLGGKETGGGSYIRHMGNYLNWIFYHATDTQRTEVSYFTDHGTFDTSDPTYHEDTRVRIRVARRVLKEVIWSIYDDYDHDPNLDKAYPRIGLTIFNSTQGGTIKHDCQTQSGYNAYKALINGIKANTWTPLSETYAEIWAYFRHGGECSITDNKYFLPLNDGSAQNISANTPITNWCQLNFIIVMTDGESTQDDQLRNLSSNSLFYIEDDNSAPWGDTDVEGVDDDDTWVDPSGQHGTNYLDDLAYFAQHNDIWPDDIDAVKNDSRYELQMKNKQFIFTYAIGFTIDNVLLSSTAKNGEGEYYTAVDYDTLLKAMLEAFASIDEKVRGYASFAAPKYSLTYGERRGYAATFVPKNNKNIWDGHLKCYQLDEDGNFPPNLDLPGSALLWDAGLVLNARIASREIMTAKSGSLVGFDNINVSAADLDFTSGIPAQDDADRDAVINFIRGDNGYNWKFGDVFHFNPVVVGAPLPWKGAFSTSYQDFYDYYTKSGAHSGDGFIRTEVVYVGANDGMLHCLKVENGDELWAFIPPSLLPKLKHSVPDVTDSLNKHNYFVDGKAIVKDVRISNNGDWTDWRTVIIFGMGIGGKTYCALDITDPTNPIFLWEFSDSIMGYTEAKPIIAQISNDGNGNNFPGVILSGGYDVDELSAPGDLEGKALFILHAYDGTLIKEFIYGATTSDPDTLVSGVYTHTNSGFKYAFTSTPTVLDYNYDGFADYIYASESGDYRGTNNEGARIWKVNIDGDPLTWTPKQIFQADDGQTIFIPPTLGFDQNFNLWVLLGTGHRPEPKDPDNETGQFIGFIDDGTISTPLDNSDFKDITNSFTNPGTDTEFSLTSYKGLYFDYVNEDAEILFEPNPIFLNSIVYFNTYAPVDSGVKDDPCMCTGNQFVYSFKLSSTGSTISIGDTDVFSGKIQGYGSFSGGKFKIYFGAGEAGSPDITTQLTVNLTDIFGPLFWLENKI
jgi:type IV pilus assembly protein PilY1